MSVDQFSEICDLFKKQGIKDPVLETKHLFDLLSEDGKKIDFNLLLQEKELNPIDLAYKRKKGVPFEYILGLADFMGNKFFCSPETFIPKRHTELLCKVALDLLNRWGDKKNLRVIDIGTGCGNIAITLALNSSNTKIFASDVNPKSLDIAKKNVDKYFLHERVSLFCGDLFSPFETLEYKEKIDCVVCNPPYIPTISLRKLPPAIVDYEPIIALDGGQFGIDFFRRLITESISILKPGGILMFEMSLWQEGLISKLLSEMDEYERAQYFGNGIECKVASIVRR